MRRDITTMEAVAFFQEHAEFAYLPAIETPDVGHLRTALAYADAEAHANRQGWYDTWERDDIDSSDFSDDPDPWPLWHVTLRDAEGEPLDSLGGIDLGRDGYPDNSAPYARVIEARLALDAST